MRAPSAWLLVAALLTATTAAARAEDLIFLSTQLRPIEEAQKMRNEILKDFPRKVDYVTEQPAQLPVRIKAEQQGGTHTIDLVGALHGELQPLVPLDALGPLDDLAATAKARGIPENLMTLGKFGTAHQLYIPWMQPSYDQLASWAGTVQEKTGKRLLGFPAGPQGLMHRFFEGFLYPSYTGGIVVPFRSEAAEAMWAQFASLWKSVNPNSTNYNFMQQPLLSGEVWIGFDHIARALDALRQRPEEFIAFPAPAGPKGRGYMAVLAGLAVMKGAPDSSGAMALLDYLTQPKTQIATARTVGFFPVVKTELPADLGAGLKMGAAAIAQTQSAKDALPALPPIGLGRRGREFDEVFMNTFQLIVLRGEKPRPVLDRQAETLRRLMNEIGAQCWQPDRPSTGACPVE